MSEHLTIKKAYNDFAGFYIAKRSDPLRSFYNDYLSNYQLKKHLKGMVKNKKVLDAGCGHGVFSNELYKLEAKVTGIDISEKLIKFAGQQYPHIRFFVSDASKTNFKNKSFDIAVSNLMVHYFKNLSPLFNEISRILKTKGVYIFSVHHPFNEVMCKQKTKKGLKILMAPYFHNNKYYWNMKDMKLFSYHHTFTEISGKLYDAGFYIELIEESRAPRAGIRINKDDYYFSNNYPTFCIFKAVKK